MHSAFLWLFSHFFSKPSEGLVDYAKAFDCVDHNKLCGIFLKRWESHATLSASWETYMQDKKQQLEPDIEQWTGSKLGKEYLKAVYFHPDYLTYMQSTSYEKCWAWWITSWNQDCEEKYQHLRYADDTTLIAESEEELKSLLMKVKDDSEKAGLKLDIQKTNNNNKKTTNIMASSPITSL